MKRRQTLALGASIGTALALPGLGLHAEPGTGKKVLRVVFPVAETGFDPVRLSDVYSVTITGHIFDAAYEFDPLARPVKLRPRVAAAMPEHSADHRIWTVRLRPGIYFADDPAFKGQRRELTAQDFVYTWKRFADPANKSPNWPSLDELRLIGMGALRKKALDQKQPFDYDTEIEGLRALDRYTLQYTLERPRPRFAESLGISATFGAVAREVVEFYGEKIVEHPVGTGPYMLAQWRRSSLIVLERNPHYRQRRWDADPAPDDAEGQAILQRMQGRLVPMIDRVEISIIEEAQPRWLSFLNAQIDLVAVPQEFVPVAMPGGTLAPHLRKKGVQGWRVLVPSTQLSFFNMEHPVVGGNEPHKVALRRAVWLSLDVAREVRLAYRGQAVPAQPIVAPGTSGYSARFKSENSEYNPARAKALLDMYGYLDRDGDGWREQPDGQPLLLEWSSQPDQLSRQFDELMKKSLDAIGIRIVFKPAKWPENLKAARAGKLMAWRVGTTATQTDGQQVLQRLYGPEAGQANIARFRLAAFDQVFDRLTALPDGPEREAAFDQAKRIAVAYAPYKVHVHQYVDILAQPWLEGYRRPLFWYDWWHLVDIDPARRPRSV
jgi:ABC-type transport system substrate-binding protein